MEELEFQLGDRAQRIREGILSVRGRRGAVGCVLPSRGGVHPVRNLIVQVFQMPGLCASTFILNIQKFKSGEVHWFAQGHMAS